MLSELDIARDVSRKLDDEGIHYMLTGSFAMNYYAMPRLTRDIDLVIELEDKDAKRFVALFEDDYYVSRDAVLRAISTESVFNLIHNQSAIKVDCIVRKNNDYRRVEFARRSVVDLKDFSMWIVSKEDLIISKLYWAKDSHSEIQLRDVKNLLQSGYDTEYVENWTRKLGLTRLWQKIVNE